MNIEENLKILKKLVDCKSPTVVIYPEMYQTVKEFEAVFPECYDPADGVLVLTVDKFYEILGKNPDMILKAYKTISFVILTKDQYYTYTFGISAIINKCIHIDFTNSPPNYKLSDID